MDVVQEALDRHVEQDKVAARRIAEACRVLPSRKRVGVPVLLVSLGVVIAGEAGVYSFGYSFGIWLFVAWMTLLWAVVLIGQTVIACGPRAHIADYSSRPTVVTCPVCKAPPGEWCETGLPTVVLPGHSRVRGNLHGDRWQAYRAAREEMGHPAL